jgi:eukaryotic-like serine/threonine-protein kinase
MATAVSRSARSRRGGRRITVGLTPDQRAASWPETAGPASERFSGTSYRVLRRIGRGGMGEVYEVEHVELGRRAALKVLHRHHHDRPDLAARLREEARLQARLRHPNLVEVFDLGVTADGRPWFAMPLLRGRDLRDELARAGALPVDTAVELVAQALDGLAEAHAAGFVHRDVKLENLFLEEDGTLRVLDFGVAKVVRAGARGHTDPGASPGTPRTMAPEQCSGGPVDARADVYAVGLALYELVAGRGPFDDLRGNDHALRYAHCERRPVAPSAVAPQPLPPALDALILRALAKSPAERFQTAAEMAVALRLLLRLGDDPTLVEAAQRPRPSRSMRRARRLSSPPGSRRRLRRLAIPWVPSVMAVAFFALGLVFGRALLFAAAPERSPAASLR